MRRPGSISERHFVSFATGSLITRLSALSQMLIDKGLPDGIGLPDLAHRGVGFLQRYALPQHPVQLIQVLAASSGSRSATTLIMPSICARVNFDGVPARGLPLFFSGSAERRNYATYDLHR